MDQFASPNEPTAEPDSRYAPPTTPCTSCPYRLDVPSGIWDRLDYEKLRRYDAPTADQPPKIWLCHLNDPADTTQPPGRTARSRVCAGWAGCHDGHHLLALRVSVAYGILSTEVAQRIAEYASPIPLFASGAEAADHGERDMERPSVDALRAMAKLGRLPRYADPDF